MIVSPICISELRAKRNSLPPKVRTAADYIIAHPDDVIHSSIQELSAKIGVSQYTVLNCIRAAGYSGYSDFKLALAVGGQEIDHPASQSSLLSDERDISIYQDMVDTFENNARCVLDTSRIIDSRQFVEIVKKIFWAKRTGIYGVGFSGYAAQYMCVQLVRLGLHAVAVTDPSYQLLDAATLIDHDLLFGFSASGSATSIIEAFQEAKLRGCVTVAVTANSDSGLARIADMSVLTTSSGPEHSRETDNSIVEQIAFASSIATAVYHELQRGNRRTI